MLFAEIVFAPPQNNFFVRGAWISLTSRIEWCARKSVVRHNFSRPNGSLSCVCARPKHPHFCTITFHLSYCGRLEKRLYAVQHNFSFPQEKGRFGGLEREQVKAKLHGKVMPQSVPVLHFRYRNTSNRYSSNRKRFDSIDKKRKLYCFLFSRRFA